jgi:hypothetical protein
MSRRHLRLVDKDYTEARRAYVLCFDEFDFADIVTTLDDQGWVVINADEDRHLDELDLRVHLAGLSVADALVLPSIWWTSTTAHQLLQIAGWMGIEFLNEVGNAIPKVGAL